MHIFKLSNLLPFHINIITRLHARFRMNFSIEFESVPINIKIKSVMLSEVFCYSHCIFGGSNNTWSILSDSKKTTWQKLSTKCATLNYNSRRTVFITDLRSCENAISLQED